MTVSRIWNRWVQDGNKERRAGSQRPPITNSREDRHVTRMTLMVLTATYCALSQELGSFARQQVTDLPRYSAVALACTFTKSLTNRKRRIHRDRATGSLPYASHYG
ncbi:HTH_Tnp_Tc3_2 domain-containing protein [Trichonephila clavipes]|nr:HTH_Tnp_Tc3_2 domain-containing protein [Trichonephila clavipes]